MFSVIIPAYNVAHCISNTIKSVLAQTISDYEIIIVDDGSTDETKNVIDRFNDPRIKYLYQNNAGVSAARNTGIRNANEKYICFLDADDLWFPNHLEVVWELIKSFQKCDVYLTGYQIQMTDGTLIQKGAKTSKPIQSDNVFQQIWEWGYFFNTNSIVCKKECFDKIGLFEVGIKNGEDDDMWYRLFTFYSVAISHEITSTYIREHSKATATRIRVDDWVFLDRAKSILTSETISEDRKYYLHRLLEQRKLSGVRNKILLGNKKGAWKEFKKLNTRALKIRKVLSTIFAFCVPSELLLAVINRRDKNYFSEK